ncbi:hypothetical protein ACWDRB_41375 [Nonomuraea sp. NPDC003707]
MPDLASSHRARGNRGARHPGDAAATPAGVVDYTVTNAVTLQASGRDIQSPTADQTITFGAKPVADSAKNLDELVFVIRDAGDADFDVVDAGGNPVADKRGFWPPSGPGRPTA